MRLVVALSIYFDEKRVVARLVRKYWHAFG
jgi:hypothetical protein